MNAPRISIATDAAVLPAGFQERVLYEACPLCGSKEIAHERSADVSRYPIWKPPLSPTMNWMRCGGCDHSFADGYFTEAALEVVFDEIHPHQRPGHEVEKNRYASAPIIEKVMAHKSGGLWLDLGFGNGSLLFTADEYGFETFGLDLRPEVVEDLQELGFSAACQDICSAENVPQADVISMADVLEHTPFPAEVLSAAHRLLNPDGVLFLSMPNAEAFLWRQMTDRDTNPYWSELEHYHNFGRRRLFALLEETGFEPLSYGVSPRYRCGMEILARKA
jgi:SAM-dependent methyltransferase